MLDYFETYVKNKINPKPSFVQIVKNSLTLNKERIDENKAQALMNFLMSSAENQEK